jgi:hypothetical protein
MIRILRATFSSLQRPFHRGTYRAVFIVKVVEALLGSAMFLPAAFRGHAELSLLAARRQLFCFLARRFLFF